MSLQSKEIEKNQLALINKSVTEILLENLILVKKNDGKLTLLEKQHNRNKLSYDVSNLTLTIC